MLEFICDQTNRLDKFLASKVDISRSRIQKAIRDGKVTVDGIVVLDPNFDVTIENKITMEQFESDELVPSQLKLSVVYENDDLAVIDKPAGLVVHPGAGNKQDTLSNALLNYYPNIKDVGEPHRPGIVHRLDEDTSGLIIIAKTAEAYDYLKKSFADRVIEKEYLALVHGRMEKTHGTIDLPIASAPTHRKMKIGSETEGKQALTEYFVVSSTLEDASDSGRASSDRLDQYTLLRVKLHTGRTHQIRVHMNAINHPLVGDKMYKSGKAGSLLAGKEDLAIIDRQFLHAYRLKFKLMDGTWIELQSKLPEDLKGVLSKIGINYDNDQSI